MWLWKQNPAQLRFSSSLWYMEVNCDWHAQMRLGIVHHCCSCILEICIYGCILRFHSQVNQLGTLYNINSSFLSYHLWNKFCLRLCTYFPILFYFGGEITKQHFKQSSGVCCFYHKVSRHLQFRWHFFPLLYFIMYIYKLFWTECSDL